MAVLALNLQTKTEILFIFFKNMPTFLMQANPIYYKVTGRIQYDIISVQIPYSRATLEGYVIAPSISIAVAKDGKAAEGSLGVGAVKSLRTIPMMLDLLPGLISDSRILSTAALGLGRAGDQRAP
jgi:hypothetical protein